MTDHVRRSGTIFRCGDYPDKQFALTPDEAAAAIAAFTPVPVDLEHTSTVLDGRLGTLESVAMGEDGTSLVGTVALPAWLDALLDEGQRKVSATWDRATKQLRGLAIVNTPRVADAALMAAFAATDEGKALVAIESAFAGKRHNTADQHAIQTIHDHAVKAGADCPTNGSAEMSSGDTRHKVSLADAVLALLGKDSTPPPAATPPARAEETATMAETEKGTTDQTDVAALVARIAALENGNAADKATIAEMKRDAVAKDAAIFADAEIAAKRALPADRAALMAEFADAAEDDAAHPRTVTFSKDGAEATGTRVDALKARHAARAPHVLTDELLRDGDAEALFNRTRAETAKEGEMSDERRKELLAKTPLGQAIIAAK
jgi:hypothetical protein